MNDRPDFSAVPVDIQERLAAREAQYAAAAVRAAGIERLQAALRDAGATARSPQGDVRVRVSSTGLLEDLEIGSRASGLGPQALSRLIMTTLRSALVQLKENVEEAVVEADAGQAGAHTLAEYRIGLAGPLSSLGDGTELRQG
jgi:DNA-binding protein YbaB